MVGMAVGAYGGLWELVVPGAGVGRVDEGKKRRRGWCFYLAARIQPRSFQISREVRHFLTAATRILGPAVLFIWEATKLKKLFGFKALSEHAKGCSIPSMLQARYPKLRKPNPHPRKPKHHYPPMAPTMSEIPKAPKLPKP